MAENDLTKEKNFATIAAIGAIITYFLLPLVIWLLKEDTFSEYTKKFLTDLLNFEIVIFIIYFVMWFIPLLGWLANIVLFVFNLIVAVKAYSASQEFKEYKFPIDVQLLK